MQFIRQHLKKTMVAKAILIISMSLVWLFILVIKGSGHATLFGKYTDNVSNISSARLFLQNGMGIYGQAAENFTAGPAKPQDFTEKWQLDLPDDVFFFDKKNQQYPIFLAWPNAPRPYPPGAFLAYMPASLLAYEADLGFLFPSYLMAFIFLLFSHIGFFRLLILTKEIPKQLKYLKWFGLFVVYCELIEWALHGQYQVLMFWPLVEMLIALRFKNIFRAGLMFAIAFFVHLHSVFFAPFLLAVLYQQRSHLVFNLKNSIIFVIAITLSLLATYTLFTSLFSYSSGNLSHANIWHWRNFANLQTQQILIFAAGIAWILFCFAKARELKPILIVASSVIIFLVSGNLGGWYSVAVLPLIFVGTKKWELIGGFSGYVLITGTFLVNSPFEFYLFKALLNAPGQ
jgi:hypothetical protein